MNQNDLQQQMAAMQERLAQLERDARPARVRRTAWAVVVGLVAGTVMAATWPANFQAGAPAKAADLNDYLNDLDARIRAGSVPVNTVAFFACPTGGIGCPTACPSGWAVYGPAEGRFIVGTNFGNAGRQVGMPQLVDGENRRHSHEWVQYTNPMAGSSRFSTFSADGGAFELYTWDNGMDTTGVGTYPLSVSDQVPNVFYTSQNSTGLPYVQLQACRKL